MSILDLFCSVDDCWQQFAPRWQREVLAIGRRRRRRATTLHPREIMTSLMLFHQSHYRPVKALYTEQVQPHLRGEFPTLVRYGRFVERMPTVLVPLTAELHTQLGPCTGRSCIASTPLVVCHNARIRQQRVFDGRAARSKNSVGWFFGFQLHRVVNDRGARLAFCLTPGHVDDRRPVPKLARQLFGKLVGDTGDVSPPLAEQLVVTQGLQLITKRRKNRHHRLLEWSDTLLLRTRAIIEPIIDQLKNISQIEHARHRSPVTFLVTLVAGRIASCHQPKKPSLGLGPLALPAT